MVEAAIYWNPEAYDTSGKALLGRHSAGEGFARGYIRYGSSKSLHLWNVTSKTSAELEPLVRRIQPSRKPIEWINRPDLGGLERVGCVNLPVPGLAEHAWTRRMRGDRAYSLCGVTHTVVTHRVLDALSMFPIAPVQPWDALICTSRPALVALQTQAESVDDYLKDRLGVSKIPRPQLVHIPLGLNCDVFETSEEQRSTWRDRLKIEADDIVILYFGRFNFTSKMNPIPMALAVERAAARTSKRVHWILCGRAPDGRDENYRESILAHCLKATVHFVDGRTPEASSIWSAADIFLSLSDNTQETFGLTPLEGMAAGLPTVVSDWDGYKDTVRHEIDGFRISTYTPKAGLGRDLAFLHAQATTTYDTFVGSTAQFTAIDVEETARALGELIENPDLRRRMGAAARMRAREVFDWKVIIPRYEELWSELNLRRRAAPAEAPMVRNNQDNPWRPDPFRMFASYPTEWLTETTIIAPAADMTWEAAQTVMAAPNVRFAGNLLPQTAEIERVLKILDERRQCSVGQLLDSFPMQRRPHLERGLVWMAKYGLLAIRARSNRISN